MNFDSKIYYTSRYYYALLYIKIYIYAFYFFFLYFLIMFLISVILMSKLHFLIIYVILQEKNFKKYTIFYK